MYRPLLTVTLLTTLALRTAQAAGIPKVDFAPNGPFTTAQESPALSHTRILVPAQRLFYDGYGFFVPLESLRSAETNNLVVMPMQPPDYRILYYVLWNGQVTQIARTYPTIQQRDQAFTRLLALRGLAPETSEAPCH